MSAQAKQIIFVVVAVALIGALVWIMRAPGQTPIPTSAGSSIGVSSSGSAGGSSFAPQQPDSALTQRIATLQDQIQKDPKDVQAMTELGALLFDAQQFNRAADVYNRALDIDPSNTDVRTKLASAYFYQGMSSTAIREFKKVIEADPNKVEPHYNLAIALSHSSPPDIDGAVAEWQQVIKLDPNSDVAKKAQSFIDSYQKQK